MVITFYSDQYIPIKRIGTLLGIKYIISYNYEDLGDGVGKWVETTLNYNPTLSQIKELVLDYYNKQIDKKILEGFKWNGYDVWLSSENQFNYKAAYDLAVQTQGNTLPVTFKFGDNLNPQYHTFETLEEFTDFYTKAIKFINDTLAEGWQKKDSIDWSVYEH